jgi:hypothetical protein
MDPGSNNKNKNNKKNNSNNSKNRKNVSVGRMLTYEKELTTTLYDLLVDYVKKQDKLDDFSRLEEAQIKAYFLDEITRIFKESVRGACKLHEVDTEYMESFLKNNWGKLRINELIKLIIAYVYDLSPLAAETSIRSARQFKKLRQDFLKDIIENWFAIIGNNRDNI